MKDLPTWAVLLVMAAALLFAVICVGCSTQPASKASPNPLRQTHHLEDQHG